ncbi:proteasome-associated protein ECM29 homolog [Drosophila ficusphila]|uniref:proteasome-associated protein ECM29 homolog n=1 Tax=Drosophila ficusphila TaxID=30025 RepID=UPI0007E68DC8|nr:proteasome-associated protein ECM29 homolog [Drosophila ficusphila]
METGPNAEIELLERVLLRLGNADSDEKLGATVGKFLTPVILKMNSPHNTVRNKVVEVLTHIKRRLSSRGQVQIPVEALLDQYAAKESSTFLKNFAIIFIAMGFPRLPLEEQTALASKLVGCEDKLESYQDKLFALLLPILSDMKIPDDPAQRAKLLDLQDKPGISVNFLNLLQDVLLLPYGITQEQDVPPGLSPYSFKRIITNNWRAEELEKVKKGIVRFLCASVFSDVQIFVPLVVASADTRFSVATPAIAELSKLCTMLDFSNPAVTAPLYTLFAGNQNKLIDRQTRPCCARVRQKLLQYLIKCRGKSINVSKGLQVIFDGLFGTNTNQKCKVLALQFVELVLRDGPRELVSKVSKVILTGITKVIGRDSTEPNDVQNAAYSALAQHARSFPQDVSQDLKLVLGYFNNLASCAPELHSSIREALVSMAPAFAWKTKEKSDAMEVDEDTDPSTVKLDGQQHLLLAMLLDNAESKIQIVQNVTSVFLTSCYPEYYAPARYLLLLIAGERNSLRENVTTFLYGTSKKDHVNYNMLSSIEQAENRINSESISDFNHLSLEQRRVVLPSFQVMMAHVHEMANKRLKKSTSCVVVGRTKLPYSLEVYEELLDYLRLCLWYSAGVVAAPGDEKYTNELRKYITLHYEEAEDNALHQYVQFVQRSVEAKRSDSNLVCLYDLLNAAPELFAAKQLHLLEPLGNTLKDVSESMRINVAQVYAILWAFGLTDEKFDEEVGDCLNSLTQKTLEHKHGWLLVVGHTFNRKIVMLKQANKSKDFAAWPQFVNAVKIISKTLCESQWLLVSAAVKCISMIGKTVEIPNVPVEIQVPTNDGDDDEEMTEYTSIDSSTKLVIFGVVFQLLRSSSARQKIREESARCLGYLAIGDGEHFTKRNLDKFLTLAKVQKDAALNIAISEAIVNTLCGYDVNKGQPDEKFVNKHCTDGDFEQFLNSLIRLVTEPNPHSRQAISVWLLAVVKHCSKRPAVLAKKELLQFAFTELLSDDSEFVQDVASRGLGLVYSLSDSGSQTDLANSLLDQLIGGKRKVNQVSADTELFAEGMLGKTPTGGNITTYKELCSLASDLNQPDMIYQFMQLANHNATWTSKLGAAFGLKTLSAESRQKMQPYLGRIIPRLYRYKYDPTPKIQNSMISIWDTIVSDSKEVTERYYWEIMRELLDNLTYKEWRVRIACCLAVRDLLKRPNGLKLRSEELGRRVPAPNSMEVDEVPEPELKELWVQLFRVMDDIHEGTRVTAHGTASFLGKLCVIASSSDHGKSGTAVASSTLPFLLETGVGHKVAEIRKVSIKTISDMIDSSGELIAPHLVTLIPCLLRATGELENTKLSYVSTRLGADNEAQEAVDTLRAEAAKSHHTMETIGKCVRYIDYPVLEKMTPEVLELMKSSVNLGTKIGCAHFVCLISIRLGKEMTPVVGKYIRACFVGIKDRNATVRKYNASAIGHLLGLAKEQSIKSLFAKLDELYAEQPGNRSIALTIQSINKRHHELLKDYMDSMIPLIFFAMHEEVSEETRANVELWKDLWNDVSPGDAGIRLNLNVIIPKLETSLTDASWSRKAQAANAIQTIATRLSSSLDEPDRIKLIKLLLCGLQGRTFEGKERLLQALAGLTKGLDRSHQICSSIIDAAMREARKREPVYRTMALASLGEILDQLEADRFEEVYNMSWNLLEKKELRKESDDEDEPSTSQELSADERNKRAQTLNRLKEVVWETLGKSWPRHSIETQHRYQLFFAENCTSILAESTRPVQVSLLAALTKYIERLHVFDESAQLPDLPQINQEKKIKTEAPAPQTREAIVEKICKDVLAAVALAAGVPHTGLKKEALNIVLMLIKRLSGATNQQPLQLIKESFESNLEKFQRDSAPEIRCRIKDIEEKLTKFSSGN